MRRGGERRDRSLDLLLELDKKDDAAFERAKALDTVECRVPVFASVGASQARGVEPEGRRSGAPSVVREPVKALTLLLTS